MHDVCKVLDISLTVFSRERDTCNEAEREVYVAWITCELKVSEIQTSRKLRYSFANIAPTKKISITVTVFPFSKNT